MIIPTIGRETLEAAKASVAGADEVIVVTDSTGDHGYTARMKGMAQAAGTHLAFLDDDDVFTPGAIELFREAASDRPVVFRMDHPSHGVLWREPTLEFGNVGTPMFLVPNVPEKLGKWEPHMHGLAEPGGDFTFIAGCVDRMGEPVWREEIVAVVMPHDRPPTIAIVTPWKDHHELLPDYEQAVAARNRTDEVIIVDDASTDPLPFATFALTSPVGFAGASNLGMREASADAVLMLNNDIRMRRPGWLASIRAALEPGVLVGANLRFDRHGDVDDRRLPYLDGWCLAGMRDDLLELGGFDEQFDEPAYYSDNDLCFRARLAGMTLRQADVGLEHLANRTAGPATTPAVMAATLANRERFAEHVRDELGAYV